MRQRSGRHPVLKQTTAQRTSQHHATKATSSRDCYYRNHPSSFRFRNRIVPKSKGDPPGALTFSCPRPGPYSPAKKNRTEKTKRRKEKDSSAAGGRISSPPSSPLQAVRRFLLPWMDWGAWHRCFLRPCFSLSNGANSGSPRLL